MIDRTFCTPACLIASLLCLTGCGPGTGLYPYRAGATVSQQAEATFECQVEAAREVPANVRVYSTAGHYMPGFPVCGDYGCYRTGGGYTIPPRVHSYDANEGLRGTYFRRCLQQKGYASIVLPNCPRGAVPPEALQSLTGPLREPLPGVCRVAVTERGSNVVALAP